MDLPTIDYTYPVNIVFRKISKYNIFDNILKQVTVIQFLEK